MDDPRIGRGAVLRPLTGNLSSYLSSYALDCLEFCLESLWQVHSKQAKQLDKQPLRATSANNFCPKFLPKTSTQNFYPRRINCDL